MLWITRGVASKSFFFLFFSPFFSPFFRIFFCFFGLLVGVWFGMALGVWECNDNRVPILFCVSDISIYALVIAFSGRLK